MGLLKYPQQNHHGLVLSKAGFKLFPRWYRHKKATLKYLLISEKTNYISLQVRTRMMLFSSTRAYLFLQEKAKYYVFSTRKKNWEFLMRLIYKVFIKLFFKIAHYEASYCVAFNREASLTFRQLSHILAYWAKQYSLQ